MNEPQFQFRGVWLPAEVMLLFKAKQITAMEMTLLSIVDGLTTANGPGCWATNGYLADMMGVHKRTIPEMLSKLRKMSLVETYTEKNRRYIVTTYAGPMPSPASPHALSGMGHLLLRNRLDNIKDNGSFFGGDSFDGDKLMATFKPKEKDEKLKDFHLLFADNLHSDIVRVRQIRRPWRKSQWAHTIRLLEKDLGGDTCRMTRVYDWWKDHMKQKGLPSILNADQFRKHFIWIEDVANKELGKRVEITADVKDIVKRLVMLGWPGLTRDLLPSVTQTSLNNLLDITRKRRKILDDTTSTSTYFLFLKHLATKFGDPRHFVEQWMTGLHEQYAKWKNWNQDLNALALTIDNPRLHKMGKSWASAYAGDARLWDRFIKDISQ